MTRAADFLSGVLFTLAICSATADAAQVEFHCRPVVLPPCENALKMHFEQGRVPNRCNVS